MLLTLMGITSIYTMYKVWKRMDEIVVYKKVDAEVKEHEEGFSVIEGGKERNVRAGFREDEYR